MADYFRLIVLLAGVLFSCNSMAESIPEPSWLRDGLVRIQKKYELPAIAAAVVSHGRIIGASAVGYRKVGDVTQVTRDDPFHLGSIAKPMTATLVGLYVDKKALDWDTPIAKMFPELAAIMKPAYGVVTVAQLLAHTSGLPYQPHTPENITDGRAKDVVGRRYEYVKAALQDEPEAAPGTKSIYSGGAIIVASYLERQVGIPYEQLMRDQIFTKLQMNHAGFGCMATGGKIDGPWEHVWRGGKFVPIAPSSAQRIQTRSPVGRNVYCSVTDLARFAVLHLDGAHRRTPFLTVATFQRLHTRMPGGRGGPGFVVDPSTWLGRQTIWHNGSNGRNEADCTIGIERDAAVCLMTNAAGGPVPEAFRELRQFLGQYLKDHETL